MIEIIRRFSHTWVAKGLLSLVAVFFVFWGIGDVIRRSTTIDYVAKVGKNKINPSAFQKEYRQLTEKLSNQENGFNEEKAKKLKLNYIVLSQMIKNELITQSCQDFGIEVNDEVVKFIVQHDKRFNDKYGNFDKTKLRSLLAANRIPESAFIGMMHQETKRNLLALPFDLAANSFEPFIKPLFNAEYEQRSVDAITIYASAMHNPEKPKDSELIQFHSDHPDLFNIPEVRKLTVIILKKQLIENEIKVSEEELKETYNSRGKTDKTFEQSRKDLEQELKAEILPNKILEITHKIEDELSNGARLETLAEKNKLELIPVNEVTAANKTLSGNEVLKLPFSDVVLKDAFNIEAGRVGAFNETSDGNWFLVRVDDIKPQHVEPFEKAKEKVFIKWADEEKLKKAESLAKESIAKINNSKASVNNLINIGNSSITQLKSVNRQGLASGKKLPKEFGTEIVSKIFKLNKNKADYCAIRGGYVVFQLKEIHKAQENKSELNSFQNAVFKMISDDLLHQLLNYMENRYPIEVNAKFMEAMEVESSGIEE